MKILRTVAAAVIVSASFTGTPVKADPSGIADLAAICRLYLADELGVSVGKCVGAINQVVVDVCKSSILHDNLGTCISLLRHTINELDDESN